LQEGSVACVNMGQRVPRIEKHMYTGAFVRLDIPANTVKKAVSSHVANRTYNGAVITIEAPVGKYPPKILIFLQNNKKKS